MTEQANIIREIVAQLAEVETETVGDTMKFIEDLGMNSMLLLELVSQIESAFEISIPENEFSRMTNLKDSLDVAQQYLQKKKVLN